jgi:hypothetical protein
MYVCMGNRKALDQWAEVTDDVNPLISCLAYESDDNLTYYARMLLDSPNFNTGQGNATLKKVTFQLDIDNLPEKVDEKNEKIRERILEKMDDKVGFDFDVCMDGKKKFVFKSYQMAAIEEEIPEKIYKMDMVLYACIYVCMYVCMNLCVYRLVWCMYLCMYV